MTKIEIGIDLIVKFNVVKLLVLLGREKNWRLILKLRFVITKRKKSWKIKIKTLAFNKTDKKNSTIT